MATYQINEGNQRPRQVFKDPQFLLLLFLNGLMIVLYETNIHQASTIIFTYFLQSVCIGFFHFFRLLSHRNSPNSKKNGSSSAFFFMFHYGMFHLVYAVFLLTLMSKIPGNVNFNWVGISLISIITSGVFETRRLIQKDKEKQSIVGFIFFIPYVRIIPIHLFIMLSFRYFDSTTFLYFLLLKTGADIIIYFIFRPTKK